MVGNACNKLPGATALSSYHQHHVLFRHTKNVLFQRNKPPKIEVHFRHMCSKAMKPVTDHGALASSPSCASKTVPHCVRMLWEKTHMDSEIASPVCVFPFSHEEFGTKAVDIDIETCHGGQESNDPINIVLERPGSLGSKSNINCLHSKPLVALLTIPFKHCACFTRWLQTQTGVLSTGMTNHRRSMCPFHLVVLEPAITARTMWRPTPWSFM